MTSKAAEGHFSTEWEGGERFPATGGMPVLSQAHIAGDRFSCRDSAIDALRAGTSRGPGSGIRGPPCGSGGRVGALDATQVSTHASHVLDLIGEALAPLLEHGQVTALELNQIQDGRSR